MTDATESDTSYYSNRFGYEFVRAPGWILEEGNRGSRVTLFAPGIEPTQGGPNMNVLVSRSPRETSLRKYYSRSVALLQLLPKFRLLDASPRSLGGEPGFEILYATQPDEREIMAFQLTTLHGGRAYSLTFTAEVDEFTGYIAEVRGMLDTFRFL